MAEAAVRASEEQVGTALSTPTEALATMVDMAVQATAATLAAEVTEHTERFAHRMSQ